MAAVVSAPFFYVRAPGGVEQDLLQQPTWIKKNCSQKELKAATIIPLSNVNSSPNSRKRHA